MLLIAAVAHIDIDPDIWHKTVYSIKWFSEVPLRKGEQSSEFVAGRCVEDSGVAKEQSHDYEKAPWARSSNIRRGVDAPFKTQAPSSSNSSFSSNAVTTLPAVPASIQARNTVGSRFIEQLWESQVTSSSRTTAECHFIGHHHFPPGVDDHDLPIPLPRLSKWVRADAIKGINVHTVPSSP
jgi:hypothetical protein